MAMGLHCSTRRPQSTSSAPPIKIFCTKNIFDPSGYALVHQPRVIQKQKRNRRLPLFQSIQFNSPVPVPAVSFFRSPLEQIARTIFTRLRRA
jgi:hypothetical protein